MKKFTYLLAALVGLSLVSVTQATVILWQDDDPASAATDQGAGLVVTPIASPVGNSAVIGDLDHGAANPFSNLTPAGPAFNVPAALQGQDWTLSFDWYVPAATVAAGNDLFYTQIDYDGVNSGSAGFINVAGATKDTWQTFSYTNSFTNVATSAEFLWLYVDGGFSGTPTTTAAWTSPNSTMRWPPSSPTAPRK